MLWRWLTVFPLVFVLLSLSASQPLSKDEALEQIQPLVTELIALRSVNALNLLSGNK
ncbi:MAG: hypothetical protein NZ937_01335 [Armatimonadetes bacterium]|nr:hypothetical protein [Armatimonadota bacterium]